MADDDQDPMAGMFPPADNPEYHRRKAEFEEKQGLEAGAAAMEQHGYLADRVTRVRKNPPQAAAATPPPRPEHRPPPEEPKEGTGIQVDPSLATHHQPQNDAGGAGDQPSPTPTTSVAVEPEPREFPLGQPQPEPAAGPTHPLLQKLRQDFGIDQIPLEEIKVGSHVFTMRVLDGNAVTTAVRFADTLSISPRENELHLQTAMSAFAVVAIVGEPLWQVFDIPLEEAERVMVEGQWRAVFDPLNPPERVRMMGSTKFMDFLAKEATMDLQAELWEAYQKKVDPKGSIEALLGNTTEGETQDLPLT